MSVDRIGHPESRSGFRSVKLWALVSCVFAHFIALGSSLRGDEKKSIEQFEQQIRPVLVEHCIKCHGQQKQEGELRLDSREAMLNGGENGPSVIPGDGSKSLLLEAIKHESLEMPPNESLTEKEIQNFEFWIANGAVWPTADANLREANSGIAAADRQWWAFRPLEMPTVPVGSEDWVNNPINAFVLERMTDHQLQPAPQAKKEVLIRRLYFDLLGLPPTHGQIQEFVDDPAPDAWEKQIDRLLADRRYGERWSRFWLDLVRYAESDGWKQDQYRADAWKYRDFVVGSFNADKPYPEFVRQQLAGDEIEGDDPENLVAAGFLRLGIFEYNQRDARGQWDDILNEMTDVAGDVFLGMSMACAVS